MIAGIGLPIELRDQSITVGTVVKAFYLLPTNSTDYTQPSIDYARRKRSSTRWAIYGLIEKFFEKYGYGDGKACLLRSICEVAAQPVDKKTGILAEIIHAILTPSTTREILDNHFNSEYHAAEKLGKEVDNCAALFPECPLNFIRQFTRILL
ncbi:DM4 12 domain containing protein [Asbolus verrucosus]|uniref:DM4 12 domain containing protein n=1 Tax=Asbolus verrucosus TaxID=1661398 RepID=A0A482VJN7_ASBVE|nr:DM4 12 domain containing protein [Asbolus verrucosus]